MSTAKLRPLQTDVTGKLSGSQSNGGGYKHDLTLTELISPAD